MGEDEILYTEQCYFRLGTRTVDVARTFDLDGVPISEIANLLQKVSVGLTDPYISLSVEDWPHEGSVAEAQVCGSRPMTETEAQAALDQQRLAERQREYMRGMPT